MAQSRWQDHLLPRGVLFATDERNELYIKDLKNRLEKYFTIVASETSFTEPVDNYFKFIGLKQLYQRLRLQEVGVLHFHPKHIDLSDNNICPNAKVI